MTAVTSVGRGGLLTAAALELLEEAGPEAMTTRRVAARVGTSSMAVYSEFGSVGGLVASVVEEGFTRLDRALAEVPITEDPIADMWQVARSYRDFGVAHPDLYAVMYGIVPAGGYRRSGPELLQGARAFRRHADFTQRAIESGRLAECPVYDAALSIWAAIHGVVALEVTGYTAALPRPAEPLLESTFAMAVVGLGDDPAAARWSMSVTPDGP